MSATDADPLEPVAGEGVESQEWVGVDPFQPDVGIYLEQVDRKRFKLLEGFRYRDPGGEIHHVTPLGVGRTDLASVPSILWWFVASYGRQTRAALVHDQLVDHIERHDADWVFRKALGDSGIGWARRWLAWCAVSFETTFRTAWQHTNQDLTEVVNDHRERTHQPRRTGRGHFGDAAACVYSGRDDSSRWPGSRSLART
jgi:hypothetical protein